MDRVPEHVPTIDRPAKRIDLRRDATLYTSTRFFFFFFLFDNNFFFVVVAFFFFVSYDDDDATLLP